MSSVTLSGPDGSQYELPLGLFINNEFVPATGGQTLVVSNPASETPVANISAAGPEDIDNAVLAAKAAYEKTWKHTLPSVRAQLLLKLADLIERDAKELATIAATEGGVPFGNLAHLMSSQATEALRYFAGWADKITGKVLQTPSGRAYTRPEPYGVCGIIVPWNSPLMTSAWKLAPALATGNVVVLKTAELAPLFGQKLGLLIKEAQFPPGVVNILTGEGRIAGQALAEHQLVRKLSFTGSTATGRVILQASARSNLKKVTLELGGKGPSIIFDDAEFGNALFWTQMGITAHNGQICAAGSRIYVHEKIYDQFIQEFQKSSENAPIGDPLSPETTKGPVISKQQHEKILGYIEKGKEEGATLLYGGQAPKREGYYVENTAFVNVKDDATIMKEEIFGPVVVISKFSTEEEVIAKANDSIYGLSAAVFTKDIGRADRVSSALEVGQVTVNCWASTHANTPFGGVKQSGFGRDLGEDAIGEWTTTKTISYFLPPSA